MKRTTSKSYGNASLLDYFTKAIAKVPKCAEPADGPKPPDRSDAPMEQSTSSTVSAECVAQDTETESQSNMRQEQEQNADENVFRFMQTILALHNQRSNYQTQKNIVSLLPSTLHRIRTMRVALIAAR